MACRALTRIFVSSQYSYTAEKKKIQPFDLVKNQPKSTNSFKPPATARLSDCCVCFYFSRGKRLLPKEGPALPCVSWVNTAAPRSIGWRQSRHPAPAPSIHPSLAPKRKKGSRGCVENNTAAQLPGSSVDEVLRETLIYFLLLHNCTHACHTFSFFFNHNLLAQLAFLTSHTKSNFLIH